MKITQWGTEPWEERELDQVTEGFSVYLTMNSGQRFRIDESPRGGLQVSSDGTTAIQLRPVNSNSVTVDVAS